MYKSKVYTVIGLMSGTSLDGIDAALIKTDGQDFIEAIDFISLPYDLELREEIRSCLGKKEDPDSYVSKIEQKLTRAHAAAVDWILSKTGLSPGEIDFIGFHGQTLFHAPEKHFTWQIGNGAMLARLTSINVVNNFRTADVDAGGQGAPLLPLYHKAIASGLKKPAVFLNIGGVANITYLGQSEELVAFDTGPGNALIDDCIKSRLERDYDESGLVARQGNVDEALLQKWMQNEYFKLPPPKSLDRDAFSVSEINSLSTQDALATLTEFTATAIARSKAHMPDEPEAWYVCGGGRNNDFLVERIESLVKAPVLNIDETGYDGDAIEAQGFAYLAVRSARGLPLTFPETTGVSKAMTGGTLHKAA
jgi:anhydro-N-acetylmuramic acid kinase